MKFLTQGCTTILSIKCAHSLEWKHTWCLWWRDVWLSVNFQMDILLNACPMCLTHVQIHIWKDYMLKVEPNWDKNTMLMWKYSVMRNKHIDGLIINHNLMPLLDQKRMQTLKAKEMKSSSKINLKDVLWWMSIKDAYKLGVTRSQVTGWNPLEGFPKSSCGKLRLGGTLPASNSRKG
jgi:hypothetical protein